jgi:putative transposase
MELNAGKEEVLASIAGAYAKEKQHWLTIFQQYDYLEYIKNHRQVRNEAIQSHYQSRFGLQARMWKLALQDAADTMDKYWKSLFDKIKQEVYKSALTEDARHYVFWILKDYSRLAKALTSIPEFKGLSFELRKKTKNFLCKKINTYRKQLPVVKLCQSFLLDENCYQIFENKGRQYINIMTLVPRKRLAVPLTGQTPIRGNIRLVLKEHRLECHYTAKLKSEPTNLHETIIAVDFGYTEVMTDNDGRHYGNDFGSILQTGSDKLKQKMQKRHKLHALQKKYAGSSSLHHRKKAKNINRFNLGRKKLKDCQQKLQATIQRTMNQAFNELAEKKPSVVVSESLSHVFDYRFPKDVNRRLSAWVKGKLHERLKFKALAKGFGHSQVNPAYSSQTCLPCGFVDRKNRNGDRFKCQHCGYVEHSDRVAAMNLKSRYSDREISRFTPYREVKRILLDRFHRQLETKKLGTVNGRIPDTSSA